MDQAALYIGYAVIGLVAFAFIGLSLLTLWYMILGFYRVFKYKQISRLIKKYETKNMYKASKTAVDFLMSKGVCPDYKISEVLDMIERYRKRNKIEEERI